MLEVSGVPLCMATQHPDSASRYIGSDEEIEEAVRDLLPRDRGGLGCDEKMIDFEGKNTPFTQPRRMVEALSSHGLTPGSNYLLTPRVPAERLETPERQLLALTASLTANKKASMHGGQAVLYVIHPMAESGYELFVAQRRSFRIQKVVEEELGAKLPRPLQVIPLLEDVSHQVNADRIIGSFDKLLKDSGIEFDEYRVMLGKSDPALLYGHLASSISLVVSLYLLHSWAQEHSLGVHVILGVGLPPSRGHLAPWSVDEFKRQYRGYETVTLQSGIRYDLGPQAVYSVVDKLVDGIGAKPNKIDDYPELVRAARIATKAYMEFLLKIHSATRKASYAVPRRRERMGTSEYPRDIVAPLSFAGDGELLSKALELGGRLMLPRAITFSAACYTIGVPHSLIGLGAGLERIENEIGPDAVDRVLELLPLLGRDLAEDLKYYRPEIARYYLGDKLVKEIEEDVEKARRYLQVDEADWDRAEEYTRILQNIIELLGTEKAKELVARAGLIRGSLG